jgi:tetratricopeptide (TPR) repeat protein
VAWTAVVLAGPYTPARDAEVLATVAAGASHSSTAVREHAAARLDAALPLAQFYIQRARDTGDMRFLGYADATLTRWRDHVPVIPAALVLDATILQSRHAFTGALKELDRALQATPDDAQAWLARATVLRVLGRYDEAQLSCQHVAQADPLIGGLCIESVRALTGQLHSAYQATAALPEQSLTQEARAWRDSLLAEMAASSGDALAAKRWFVAALRSRPMDAYTRAAYADLLLEEGRTGEALALLEGHEGVEPLLLRLTIAQERLHDPRLAGNRALLASAFSVEEQRGESVHRREEARFYLDVVGDASAALKAAEANWAVQHEPADVLLLLRAAHAAGRPDAAAPALQFLRQNGTEDVRFDLDHVSAS